MGRTAATSFCPSKPKTVWRWPSLSTYLLENCAKQASSTLSIVYTPKQKIWSTQACSMTAAQVHNRCYFFYANCNILLVSVAVSAPGDDKRCYSHDAIVMSRWQNDDRIIAVQPMVICFSREKQVSVASKDVYRPSTFFFPTPTSLRWRSINPRGFFITRARRTLKRK